MQTTVLEKLQIGDEKTVELLVRELYPKLYAYIYRRIYNQEKAKDITQDTFCRFFAHIDQYEEKGKLLNYLYRIALRLIYDDTKKIATSEIIDENLVEDTTHNTHDIVMRKNSTYILRKWIDELPNHLQEVIWLRYEEDLKFKDISKILGVNVSTIKSRLKLAIMILKEKAKEEQLR